MKRTHLKKFAGLEWLIYQPEPAFRPEALQLWARFLGGRLFIFALPEPLVSAAFRIARFNTLGGAE